MQLCVAVDKTVVAKLEQSSESRRLRVIQFGSAFISTASRYLTETQSLTPKHATVLGKAAF